MLQNVLPNYFELNEVFLSYPRKIIRLYKLDQHATQNYHTCCTNSDKLTIKEGAISPVYCIFFLAIPVFQS